MEGGRRLVFRKLQAKNAPSVRRKERRLFDKLLNRAVQFVDGVPVLAFHCVHDAVLQVVLEDDLAGVVNRAADGGELHQHLDRKSVV